MERFTERVETLYLCESALSSPRHIKQTYLPDNRDAVAFQSLTPPDKQRFDVCVQIPEFRNPSGHIGCQTILPGLFGVGRHYGSFETLSETYMHVYDSLVTAGKYRLRQQAPFEVYSYSHVKDDIRIHFTDVYLPVEATEKQAEAR